MSKDDCGTDMFAVIGQFGLEERQLLGERVGAKCCLLGHQVLRSAMLIPTLIREGAR